MKRPFCNLSASDYGLKDTPDSFRVAKEINATIVDVIDTDYLRYEDKWRAIYSVLTKYKNMNATNPKAIDTIEAILFLNGVNNMQRNQKPQDHRLMIRDNERLYRNHDDALFLVCIAGVVAICAGVFVGATIDQIAKAAGAAMLAAGWWSWVK